MNDERKNKKWMVNERRGVAVKTTCLNIRGRIKGGGKWSNDGEFATQGLQLIQQTAYTFSCFCLLRIKTRQVSKRNVSLITRLSWIHYPLRITNQRIPPLDTCRHKHSNLKPSPLQSVKPTPRTGIKTMFVWKPNALPTLSSQVYGILDRLFFIHLPFRSLPVFICFSHFPQVVIVQERKLYIQNELIRSGNFCILADGYLEKSVF